jgi:flagellar basal-body rod modification protein FlgD
MITAISGADANTTASLKKTAGLDKNDFMQLLLTQLKSQDPLNPQDPSEFVSQLAQLTQVEQIFNINTNLQHLLSSQNNFTSLSAMSLIGKNITTSDLSGLVTGVKLDNDIPVLTVNGTDVPITSVLEVKGGSQ